MTVTDNYGLFLSQGWRIKSFPAGRLPCGLLLFVVLTVGLSSAEESSGIALPVSRTNSSVCTSLDKSPDCRHNRLHYLGAYTPYGKFETASSRQRWYNQATLDEPNPRVTVRPADVPGWVNLHPLETVVENYAPPARANRPIRGQSKLAAFRDDLITALYGKENALLRPTHITADSKGRVIVCDPGAGGVHVLSGKSGFRIAAGPRRWLQVPAGVAVDAHDNIYISDSERGTVQVYDSEGRFRTEFGRLTRDETLFQRPGALAIDAERQNLYLLDPPRNLLIVLDREGRILNRIGRGRPVEFDRPSQVTIRNGEVFVLDSRGERIQVLDLDGNLLRAFGTRYSPTANRQIGLGVDSDGNVYLSNIRGSEVWKYDPDGRLLAIVGQRGMRERQFNSPGGLWIDSTNRLYIADTMNRRVQVFQLEVTPGTTLWAGIE